MKSRSEVKTIEVVNKRSVSISGLLGVAFVVLKLVGVITWPWWLVTLPFWWILGLTVAIMVVSLAVAGLATLVGLIVLGIQKLFN